MASGHYRLVCNKITTDLQSTTASLIESSEHGSGVIENDTIELLLDCERLNRTVELPVDINQCAFPWQLYLNLYQPQTRVRIISFGFM